MNAEQKNAEQSFKSVTVNPQFSEVKDISVEEVYEKKKSLCLIDVRRQDEFHGELEHIHGATLMTLDTLTSDDDNISSLPKEGPIVFICRSGNRSAHACAWAQKNGRGSVYNMKGGMIEWNEKNFETEAE